ncbi:MAG TPA: GAF domain-containing protein [Methylomirabilota bacterium]|nr:GAF domain-containing protein [Methylomirabilota bacterium]
MGHGDDQPPQAAPDRRTTLIPATRPHVARLSLVLAALAALWGAGGVILHRQLEARQATRTRDAVAVAQRVVEDVQQSLLREARLLAREPAVVAGAARGDWGMLAREASPRLISLSVEGIAELLMLIDGNGATLVQVPTAPRVVAAGLGAPTAPTVRARVLAGQAYLLATAPILGLDGAPVGTAAVGRNLARVERAFAGAPATAVLVAVDGDRVIAASRTDVPTQGWQSVIRTGRVSLAGATWSLWPLAGNAGVWALVSGAEDARELRWLWGALVVSFLAASAALVGGLSLRRPPPVLGLRALVPLLDTTRRLVLRPGEPSAEIFAAVARSAAALPGARVARVWIHDPARQELRTVATCGVAPAAERMLADLDTVPCGHGVIGYVFESAAPLNIADVQQDPRWLNRGFARAAGLRGYAGIPIVAAERAVGVLAILFGGPRRLTPEEIELMRRLADQAALAVTSAQRVGDEEVRRAQLGALLDINRKIGAAQSTDALLHAIAEEAARLLDVDNAGFRLVEGGDLVVAGLAGAAGETMLRPRIKIGESLSGRVVEEARSLTSSLAEAPDLLPDHRAADERLGYTHWLGVPVMAGQRAIGVFAFRARRPFTAQDQELAEAFAAQAAVVLGQTRLYREAQRQAERMRALADVERLLSETLDPDVVAQRIADSVRTMLGALASAVYRLEPETGHLVAIADAGDSDTGVRAETTLPRGEGVAGLAVRERRTVASPDLLTDPAITLTSDLRARVERAAYRSVLAVPLRVHDRVIGALGVTDRPGRIFGSEDVYLAEAFGAQAALALENARLYSLEAARRAQIETLARIEREFAAELNLDRLLGLVIDRATRLFAAEGVIHLANDQGVLEPCAWSDRARFDRPAVLGHGVTGACAAERRGLLLNDYPTSPYALPDYVALGFTRFLAHPLTLGERCLGVITLSRTGPGPPTFTADDLAVLESLATQAAIAIDNARLHEELEARTRRLRMLATVNRIVSSSLDTGEVLRTIACAAAELMGGTLVAFWIADESTRTLWIGAFSDEEVGADFPIASHAFGEGAAGWVAEHRRPLDVADVRGDPRFLAREWGARHGIVSFFGIPLLVQDSLLGVLTLNGQAPFHFTPDEENLLESFAAQAAVALQHARVFGDTTRRLDETRALLEVVEILNSTLDPHQLLKRVAIKIAQVCQVDRCTIERGDARRLVPLTSQFADGHAERAMWEAFVRGAPYAAADVPARARALETRRPVVVEDATNQTEHLPREWVETFRQRSCLFVPLINQDQVIGLLTLDYCERPVPFQRPQVALAAAIAGQLALALESTRLYAEAQERLRETTTLLAVGQVLSQATGLEETMRRLCREVGRAFGADTVGAYVLDETGERLHAVAGYHVPEELRAWLMANPITVGRQPRLREDWQAGRAVWSFDTHRDDRFDRDWVMQLPPHAVMFAPTRVRGKSMGALLLVWWTTGRQFPPADVRLLEGVAAQVGLALENAELARQREVRLKETVTLLEVSRTLSSTLELDMLLRHFMRQISQATGADVVGVWMLDEDGEHLVPTAGFHVPPEWRPAARTLRISLVEHSFYAEAVRTRRAVFAAEAAGDARIPRTLLQAAPHRSQLFVPILAKERLVAAFMAVWRERPREFSAGELALMEAIASQAGVGFENARLFEQNRRQVEELSVLHELARAVTGQLDRQALLEALRLQLPRVLAVDQILVILVEHKSGEVDTALRVEDGRVVPGTGQRDLHAAGLAAVVLDTGQPLRTDDYAAECARRGLRSADGGAPSRWLGVPLLAGQSVLGVLTLSRRERRFTDAEVRLADSIADLAALALRSARLFEERSRAYSELAAAQDHLVRTEKLRALGEMASGVAHDFNNMLAAILGRTQLLLRRIEDPKVRQWLQVIERSALDGAQTVRRLQELARVRRDQPLVPVDLNQVVRDAVEMTQSRWHEDCLRRGIVIDVRTRLGEISLVAGDPAELREAMTNLILNAVDAMPAGGVLTFTSELVDGEVRVTVSDSGVGIPEAIRDSIFDPFFTTKGPQGTGLGLSMTYGILSRHRARITVESQEGQGSTFRLRFPALASWSPTQTAAPEAPAEPRPLRCLVVDDEESVGAVIGDVLASLGHDVMVLTDGAAAIERLGDQRFDAVFTDLAMPGVSGWQVARAVKDKMPDVPVFMVTGFGVELTPEEQRANGVTAVLAKPLNIDDLVNALAQVARPRGEHEPLEER